MSADGEERTPSTTLARWLRRNDVLTGAAVFVGMVIAGLIRNPWIVRNGRIEDGDFGVNSILIDKAKDLQLLVGNYSRVGFNHPGPALMYVQAAGEGLFYDLIGVTPRPYNAHVLAILCLCAAMVALSASIAVRHTEQIHAGGLVLVAALLIGVLEPGSMVSTSFPEVYIWSYLLLVVATAAVLAGASRELPYVVLAAGFLCHGHVSFFMFTGGFGIAIAVVIWRRWPASRPTPRVWLGASTVAALFALPFLLNLLLDWPGEVDDYWNYSRGSKAGGHSWIDVARFIGQFWSATDVLGGVIAVGLIVAATALSLCARPPVRAFALGLVGTAVLSTVLLFVYAKRGVDDLSFRYVAEFYVTAPVAVLLATGLVVADRAVPFRFGQPAVWSVVGVASLLLVAQPEMKARYPGANWIGPAEQFLDQQIDPDQTRVVRFALEVWPATAGIVEQSRRTGSEVCIDDPNYGFLFDESMVCDDAQRAAGVVVSMLAPGQRTDADVSARLDDPRIVIEILGEPAK